MILIGMIAIYNCILIYEVNRFDESALYPDCGFDYNCATCIYKVPQCIKINAINKKYCLIIW